MSPSCNWKLPNGIKLSSPLITPEILAVFGNLSSFILFLVTFEFGLTVNSILSKYYGTEFPGKGTLFLGYQYIFLAPIYPNEEYNVEISFMKEVKKTGLYESLIKIKDGKGKICVISYNTLKKNITK